MHGVRFRERRPRREPNGSAGPRGKYEKSAPGLGEVEVRVKLFGACFLIDK